MGSEKLILFLLYPSVLCGIIPVGEGGGEKSVISGYRTHTMGDRKRVGRHKHNTGHIIERVLPRGLPVITKY